MALKTCLHLIYEIHKPISFHTAVCISGKGHPLPASHSQPLFMSRYSCKNVYENQ